MSHTAHLYFYSPRPLFKKSSDNTFQTQKIMANEVPAIEVKSSGGNGIMFCTPSLHKSGYRYTIIGIPEPVMLNIRQANVVENMISNIWINGKTSIAGYSVSIQFFFICNKPSRSNLCECSIGGDMIEEVARHRMVFGYVLETELDLICRKGAMASSDQIVLGIQQIFTRACKHSELDYYYR